MSADWSGGSTRAWRKLRQQILERDSYLCRIKIEGICAYRADCVHHLYGKAGGDHPDGLVAACTACNAHVGNPARKKGGKRTADPACTPRTRWLDANMQVSCVLVGCQKSISFGAGQSVAGCFPLPGSWGGRHVTSGKMPPDAIMEPT